MCRDGGRGHWNFSQLSVLRLLPWKTLDTFVRAANLLHLMAVARLHEELSCLLCCSVLYEQFAFL